MPGCSRGRGRGYSRRQVNNRNTVVTQAVGRNNTSFIYFILLFLGSTIERLVSLVFLLHFETFLIFLTRSFCTGYIFFVFFSGRNSDMTLLNSLNQSQSLESEVGYDLYQFLWQVVKHNVKKKNLRGCIALCNPVIDLKLSCGIDLFD